MFCRGPFSAGDLVSKTNTFSQYTVFRITLALAASGVAGVIPGMIRLKVQPGAALLIHAGGALAVFVIVYLLAPGALPSEFSSGDTKKLKILWKSVELTNRLDKQ